MGKCAAYTFQTGEFLNPQPLSPNKPAFRLKRGKYPQIRRVMELEAMTRILGEAFLLPTVPDLTPFFGVWSVNPERCDTSAKDFYLLPRFPCTA